jgi:hypothetical protein
VIRRKTDNRRTFTKKAVKYLLIIGVINSEIPYILAAFDKDPVESLAIAWITEVVAVIAGYMVKSYFETKQERKQNHEDYLAEKDNGEEEENYNADRFDDR